MSAAEDFREGWFVGELTRLHDEFRRGDYSAFMEALLLCCWNQHALPEWLATVVIEQSEATFAKNATGHGRQGNRHAALHAKQVDDHRANMVALAPIGAGAKRTDLRLRNGTAVRLRAPDQHPGNSFRVVKRSDSSEFVSKYLRGTPARGSPRAIEDSYKKIMRARKQGTE